MAVSVGPAPTTRGWNFHPSTQHRNHLHACAFIDFQLSRWNGWAEFWMERAGIAFFLRITSTSFVWYNYVDMRYYLLGVIDVFLPTPPRTKCIPHGTSSTPPPTCALSYPRYVCKLFRRQRRNWPSTASEMPSPCFPPRSGAWTLHPMAPSELHDGMGRVRQFRLCREQLQVMVSISKQPFIEKENLLQYTAMRFSVIMRSYTL